MAIKKCVNTSKIYSILNSFFFTKMIKCFRIFLSQTDICKERYTCLKTLFRQLLHRWIVDCATFCVADKTASNLLFCSKGYTEQITGDQKGENTEPSLRVVF